MFSKKLVMFAVLLTLTAGAAYAQQVWTVGKDPDGDGMFRTVQEAINAAHPGDIVEILDNEVYNEQITIDGRSPSPWNSPNQRPGGREVIGGKSMITVRSRSFWLNPNTITKPVIYHHDTRNISPKGHPSSLPSGDTLYAGSNYKTNGAFRVLHTKGIIIEGIIIDGGGRFAFADAIPSWGGELVHGNAALAVLSSGGTVVRNSELRNAYFGMYIDDHSNGGTFAEPSPGDNPSTMLIPMGEFGMVGNHMFEFNRIYNNAMGTYVHFAWDLASTFRNNLVYDNYHRTNPTSSDGWPDQRPDGAFYFQQTTRSPFAIYNNTFFRNSDKGIFFGRYRAGSQHLIFNNIYSAHYSSASSSGFDGFRLDRKFPNRMNNVLFSGDRVQTQNAYVQECQGQGDANIQTFTIYDNSVRIGQNMPAPAAASAVPGGTQVTCNNGTVVTTNNNQVTYFGAPLTGGNPAISENANWRWLETGRTGPASILPLFQSIDPVSPNFLRPDWSNALVQRYIQGQGWRITNNTQQTGDTPTGSNPIGPGAGMRNYGGGNADLGAIPSVGVAPATVARILPTAVVMIDGGTATANFQIRVEKGQFLSPTIKFMRWVSLPVIPDQGWGGEDNKPVVPAATYVTSYTPVTPLQVGNNTIRFTATAPTGFGFLEFTVEGTDGEGNLVTSDVGFLPFRELAYLLDLGVYPRSRLGNIPENSAVTKLTEVFAGDTVLLRVEARQRQQNGGTTPFTSPALDNITYRLASDANITCVSPNCPSGAGGQPLGVDINVPYGKEYLVVFTVAGAEAITAAGFVRQGNAGIAFQGVTTFKVRPGAPDKLVFRNPMPRSEVPVNARPPAINRGLDYEAVVVVQDRFGNGVDQALPVSISTVRRYRDWPAASVTVSNQIEEYVGPTSGVMTSIVDGPDMGTAKFTIRLRPIAATGDIFDMRAVATSISKQDDGALRVGASFNILRVFYGDNQPGNPLWGTYYNEDSTINGVAGEWKKVTVKATAPDSVMVGKNGWICVEPDPSNVPARLQVSRTEDGSQRTSMIQMTNGVAEFWITSTGSEVEDGDISVKMLTPNAQNCNDEDNSIGSGYRTGIFFIESSSDIAYAVLSNDGWGRPDTALIFYKEEAVENIRAGAMDVPDSVELVWPVHRPSDNPSTGVMAQRSQARVDTLVTPDGFALRVVFTGLSNRRAGFTSVGGINDRGAGHLHIYNTGGTDHAFPVFDRMYPVISDTADGIGRDGNRRLGPMLLEDTDTLFIPVSEPIRAGVTILAGGNVWHTATLANPGALPAAGDGSPLNVTNVAIDGDFYRLALNAVVPQPGEWVRFNPAAQIVDFASTHPANGELNLPTFNNNTGVRADNRWVRVALRERAPKVLKAYYTADPKTGFLDKAYITYDKSVNLVSWFEGGSFIFGTDTVTYATLNNGGISVGPSDSTLVIDLRIAWPSRRNIIFTSGSMDPRFVYSQTRIRDHGWPSPVIVQIGDGAAPVVLDTVFYKFGKRMSDSTRVDTLKVTYSEAISTTSEAVTTPVKIVSSSSGRPEYTPVLRRISSSTVSGGHRVLYAIESGIDIDLVKTGDSARIIHTAGIGDIVVPSNVQDDELNRLAYFRFDWGEIEWDVRVKNNPFKSGGTATIVLDPAMWITDLNISYTIQVFDNMGNLVNEKKGTQLSGSTVEWKWTGHNINGRMVGTGTYMFRANMRVTHVNGELVKTGNYPELVKPSSVRRMIGFVR